MNQEQLLAKMKAFSEQNLETARRKNNDYAGDGDAFKNFRGCERHGVSLGQGLLVRMEDKMARLGNLLQKDPSVVGESIIDSALDLANYALILAAWWENEQPVSQDVVDRGDSQHINRLSSGSRSTTGSVSYLGNIRQLRTEPADRSDLYDNFHGS